MNDSSATPARAMNTQRDALPNGVRRVLVPGVGGPGLAVVRFFLFDRTLRRAVGGGFQGEDGSALPEVSSADRVRGSLVVSLRRDRVLAGGPDGPALRG